MRVGGWVCVGEGGIGEEHLRHGGDIVWQIGTFERAPVPVIVICQHHASYIPFRSNLTVYAVPCAGDGWLWQVLATLAAATLKRASFRGSCSRPTPRAPP